MIDDILDVIDTVVDAFRGPKTKKPSGAPRRGKGAEKMDTGRDADDSSAGGGTGSGESSQGGNTGSGSGGTGGDRPARGRKGLPFGRIALVIILLMLIVGNGIYSVAEQENAVVTMFGRVIRTDTAGLHFKFPLLQQAHIVDMTTHGTGIGYEVDGNGQNINVQDEGIMITSDFNFVDIDFYLEYKVSDPVQYIYNSQDPEGVLKNAALAAIRSTVSDFAVDDVITTGKSQIQAEIRERLAASLTKRGIGLQVVNIQIQDAEPPTAEIVQAFKSVETAKQGKETALNNANRYRNESLPTAEANADKTIQYAEAAKEARIAEAQGQVARFEKMYEEYVKYPGITKQRLYFETIENVLKGQKVIITDGHTQQVLPLDSFTGQGAAASGSGASVNAAEGGQ